MPIERRTSADLTRSYLAARRHRERLFGTSLFTDPAWDMLLDLYASEMEGRRICITSACLASQVPNTTALGWLYKLERRELITRHADAGDKRRVFVNLTPNAFRAVEEWVTTNLAPHLKS